MARKLLNRKELRQESEAAENREAAQKERDGPTTAKKTPAKKTTERLDPRANLLVMNSHGAQEFGNSMPKP